MTIKQSLKNLHRWLGFASGLVVFIVGITGCLYAFMDELKPWLYQQRMYISVPSESQRLPLAVIQEKAQQAIGTAYPLQLAEVPVQANRTVVFRTLKINRDQWWYGNYMAYYYRIYMNPYTGSVVKKECTKWEFFTVVVNLHIHLLLSPALGGKIVNWGVVAFVLLLISGLVLWWPKNKAAAKQRFWFNWKKGTRWKRKNYDLHNILGCYAISVLLVIAITGLVWSFEAVRDTVQWVANSSHTYAKPAPVFSDSTNRRSFSPDNILQQAIHHHPGATTFLISLPTDHKSAVSVYARHDKHPQYRNVISLYDQHTATLIRRNTFSGMNNGEKIYALNYDLHVGSIIGLPGKILAFFASLIAASLPVTGLYIWLGRKQKQSGKVLMPLKRAA
ncbi:PepSY-associated TM helix domain-containing protein [Chitinophaga nivalis]|uniref:PepSY domain-containing protein n=1 Tax=Chitinophaga nivalis TaxID=2991709 RepID=A0ABT3IQ49_9BACT|nr:PepSY-associated TM helix domain-containing protein [Chitinophaga nivalis]MCW3464213.1 PepSY domain-containing protein [Chitinophaga nivalis]MCW3486097.1 PepSY domain-containing protein [Chitinophaga nivalis]